MSNNKLHRLSRIEMAKHKRQKQIRTGIERLNVRAKAVHCPKCHALTFRKSTVHFDGGWPSVSSRSCWKIGCGHTPGLLYRLFVWLGAEPSGMSA